MPQSRARKVRLAVRRNVRLGGEPGRLELAKMLAHLAISRRLGGGHGGYRHGAGHLLAVLVIPARQLNRLKIDKGVWRLLAVLRLSLNQLDRLAVAAGYHADLHIKRDRKSTRLNSSHVRISYAVFC